MKTLLPPGTYIAAVSGGIDSVALLHMLHSKRAHRLIVVHVDHGIRSDSHEDARFVQGLAAQYELPFEMLRLELGADASEGTARTGRYAFLRSMATKYEADAIVTAHHQDDQIETAVINMLRGTMRRGLVALRSREDIRRPLLTMTKQEIREYVMKHQLEWCEDSTNASDKYLRNRVRARLHGSLTTAKRTQIVSLLQTIEADNALIDTQVAELLHPFETALPRVYFSEIDAGVLFELIAQWLRLHQAIFDKNTIVRICNGARTLQTGAKIDVDKHYYCLLTRSEIILTRR